MTNKAKLYVKLGLIKTINGKQMWHGAACLYIAADGAYSTNPENSEARRKGARVMSSILEAARNAGYAHADDLRERLSKGMRDQTTANMAMEAVDAIGGEIEFMRALDRAGFNVAHQMPTHTGCLQ